MAKAAKKTETEQLGVIARMREGMSSKPAMVLGHLFGGIVPVCIFLLAHYEARGFEMTADEFTWTLFGKEVFAVLTCKANWLTGFGLVFSAKTVRQWAAVAFEDTQKATGFVVLLEGVMTFSGNFTLALVILAFLVAINAMATGCTLALRDKKDQARRQVKKTAPKAKKSAPKHRKPVMDESGEFKIEAA